jgi:TatD DNase family protein
VAKVINFCEQHQNIYTTAGIHPEIANKYPHITLSEIAQYTTSPYVVGVGECGLDYFYNLDIKEQQINVFQEHIKVSQQTGLPLIIHSRDADDDMQQMLAEAYKKQPFTGELHCFSSSEKLAEFALSIGFYISASGIITFKKSEDLRQIFAQVPLNRLLIETDSPFLAPMPHRGKRNEPSFVVNTAQMLAEIKHISITELADITTDNFFNLFTKAKK